MGQGFSSGCNGMRYIFLILLLTGCQDRFRYPCMDKNNWEKPECQRPQCAITQMCPDMLLKAEDMKAEIR